MLTRISFSKKKIFFFLKKYRLAKSKTMMAAKWPKNVEKNYWRKCLSRDAFRLTKNEGNSFFSKGQKL
jgi:hypothetical protein